MDSRRTSADTPRARTCDLKNIARVNLEALGPLMPQSLRKLAHDNKEFRVTKEIHDNYTEVWTVAEWLAKENKHVYFLNTREDGEQLCSHWEYKAVGAGPVVIFVPLGGVNDPVVETFKIPRPVEESEQYDFGSESLQS